MTPGRVIKKDSWYDDPQYSDKNDAHLQPNMSWGEWGREWLKTFIIAVPIVAGIIIFAWFMSNA
jgi:hypothetical protein